MPKSPLKLRELLRRLTSYGVVVMERSGSGTGRRGKGSEIILLLPEKEGSKRGAIYPVKNHGMGTEISIPVIQAILRRFDIDPGEFWRE